MRISEEQLRHDLIRVKDLLNHVPSKREYEKFGNYGKATYQRNWGSWNKALQDCLGEIRQISPASFIEVECIQCKSMFLPKSHDQKLCSKVCSLNYVNKTVIKRKKTKKCKCCDNLIFSSRTYCQDCIIKERLALGEKTLEEVEYRRGSNRYGVIRQHARTILRSRQKICEKCGYSKHAEICHKKPIKKFDKKSLVKEINHPTNLVILCPNCHWELDHGM